MSDFTYSSEKPPKVWQIGSGPDGREFRNTLIEYNVALLGPGDVFGEWSEEKYLTRAERRDWFPLRRFYKDVRKGDLVIMRSGKTKVEAIGVFAEDHAFFNDFFGDVSGWDLQHTRRVIWWQVNQCVADNSFGARPTRFNQVHNAELIRLAMKQFSENQGDVADYVLREIPDAEPVIASNDSHISHYLERASEYFEALYTRHAHMSENEAVCHMVVPLLRTLGWSENSIALEWSPGNKKRVDIALINKYLPDGPDECSFLIEVKRPEQPFEKAYNQAMEYAIAANADLFFLTDGFYWRCYRASELERSPIAKAKLTRFTKDAELLLHLLRKTP